MWLNPCIFTVSFCFSNIMFKIISQQACYRYQIVQTANISIIYYFLLTELLSPTITGTDISPFHTAHSRQGYCTKGATLLLGIKGTIPAWGHHCCPLFELPWEVVSEVRWFQTGCCERLKVASGVGGKAVLSFVETSHWGCFSLGDSLRHVSDTNRVVINCVCWDCKFRVVHTLSQVVPWVLVVLLT